MPKQNWTDEERKAFAAKMREARAKVKPKPLTLEQKINGHYQRGEGSIQDIARVYGVDVEEVLQIIGQDDMIEVPTQGDMVDQAEVGPLTKVEPYGKTIHVPYTTN